MTIARMLRLLVGYVGARFLGAGVGLLSQILLARLLPQADVGAFEFIHATADTDGDGLSDHDEIGAYGTDPIHADPDGDGQSDREELIAGMDPYDPASFFAILDATNGTSGGVFTWPGRDHRLYTVYAADNLVAGMTNRPDYTDQPGADGLMAFTNSSPGAATMFGVGVRLAP